MRGIIPISTMLREGILTFINTSLIFIVSVEYKSLGLVLVPGLWGVVFPSHWMDNLLSLLEETVSFDQFCFTWFWALFLVITIFFFNHHEKKSFQKRDFACFYWFSKLLKINVTLEKSLLYIHMKLNCLLLDFYWRCRINFSLDAIPRTSR